MELSLPNFYQGKKILYNTIYQKGTQLYTYIVILPLKKMIWKNTREIKKMSNKQPTYLYTIPTITTTTKDYYYNMTIPT